MNKMSKIRIIKMLCIIISVIIVLISLTGNLLTSSKGSVSLTLFESFYVYLLVIAISIYMIIKNNKNANVLIVAAIATYGWTHFLVQDMINSITQIKIVIEPLYYIYLGSALPLVVSLFLNDSKQLANEIPESFKNANINIDSSLNKDNFIFASFVLGLKGIPLNTEALLVNNTLDNSLDIIYAIDNNNQTIKIPISDVKSIKAETSMRMQNTPKEIPSNEKKSALLSAVVFGGNPMLQLIGNSAFNSFFDGFSSDYNKVSFNAYFEITIDTIINGEETTFIFNTDLNPNVFINQVNSNIK